MNIDDELKNLASEAHELPSRMNIERIRKTAKRRKTIHSLAVAGRSLLIVVCAFFLSLFIGVNTSSSFARACSDLPVIGSVSRAMVLRSEIRDSLRHNKDIEDAVAAGDFIEVSMADSGKKNIFTYKIDSYLADEASFSFFSLLETDRKLVANGFSAKNIRITDLDTGKQISSMIPCSLYSETGIATFSQFFWEKPASNFVLEFDMEDANIMPDNGLCASADDRYVDSFRFEFRNVQIASSKKVDVNQVFDFKGNEIKFTHLLLSGTATKVFVDFPAAEGFRFGEMDFYITDENGEVISDPTKHNGCMHCYQPEGAGKNTLCYVFPSILYKNPERIQIHIVSISCSTFDTRLLEVHPGEKRALFAGKELPIEVYDSSYSYKDFGLQQQPFYSTENTLMFLIPKEKDMPVFNSIYSPENGGRCSYDLEYPTITKDGKEYILIECPTYFESPDNMKQYYFFASAEDFEKLRLYQRIDINI